MIHNFEDSFFARVWKSCGPPSLDIYVYFYDVIRNSPSFHDCSLRLINDETLGEDAVPLP